MTFEISYAVTYDIPSTESTHVLALFGDYGVAARFAESRQEQHPEYTYKVEEVDVLALDFHPRAGLGVSVIV